MPARRVLVPILVLGLAGALWRWSGSGGGPIAPLPDDVGLCCGNLREIYAGLILLEQREGHSPEAAGEDPVAALFRTGIWEDSPARHARLVCPGPGAQGAPYAFRDLAAFPMTKFPSGGAELEPIAACPDTGVPAHDGCLNVLYSDGSVRTLTLQHEIESGRLAPGAKDLPVGKGSPIPDLAKLVASPN